VARRLILWDIDGTLVRAGDVGGRVFEVALERVLGRRPQARVAMSGKTDPQIAREFLVAMAEDDMTLLPLVLEHLERELAAAAEEIATLGAACHGAEAVVAALAAVPEVHQSVLTGNLAANALVKLAAFGLDRHLDLEGGAFGSDEEDRCLLVPVALGRQRERGRRFTPEETWIVGDSPRDLECARAGGAHCLLVGTGRYPLDELAPLGADHALADLGDLDEVLGILLPA